MTMFSDEQLEQRLSATLHEEMSELEPPAKLAATVWRRHNRRMWNVRIGGALSVVVAAAVGVTLAQAPRAPAVSISPSAVLDIRYVSAETTAALANRDDYLGRTHLVRDNGTVTDEMVDLATGRKRVDEYDGQGKHVAAYSLTGSGDAVVVDYENRAWWESRKPIPAGANIPRNDFDTNPEPQPSTETSATTVSPLVDPAEIQNALDAGRLELVGPDTVEGRETVHLRWTTTPSLTLDLWVDASSYLPVRKAVSGPTVSYTVAYAWLPRTAENLALLDLTAPVDFTHREQSD